jgi:hypothetical protein
MDTVKFDAVSRLFGQGMTRREALRGLVAGAAAVTAGGTLLQVEDASAKRRRRKHRKQKSHQDRCGRHGDGCGAFDADTGEFTPPYCCHGYECVYSTSNGSSSWTCQVRP